MQSSSSSSSLILVGALVAVAVTLAAAAPAPGEDIAAARVAALRSSLLRQFVGRYPPMIRRFDASFPTLYDEEYYPKVKRNNAELVNHIIKNFGAIDRLGDVGK